MAADMYRGTLQGRGLVPQTPQYQPGLQPLLEGIPTTLLYLDRLNSTNEVSQTAQLIELQSAMLCWYATIASPG